MQRICTDRALPNLRYGDLRHQRDLPAYKNLFYFYLLQNQMREEKKSLYLSTKSLKDLLQLFEEDAVLKDLELGDTWHPFSGYVDEKILGSNPTVKQVLRFDYDFKGLVHFQARIGTVLVELETDNRTKYTFRIKAESKKLVQLEHLVIEMNAYAPGRYKIL